MMYGTTRTKLDCVTLFAKAFYCPECKDEVFWTDGLVAMKMKCETCQHDLNWIEGDSEEIAAHVGIPVSEWTDLR